MLQPPRRSPLIVSCLLGLAALAGGGCRDRGGSAPSELPPPNVVLIVTDDLGFDDVGCYWSENPASGFEKIDTPRLDAMAAEGTRFTSFYSAAPVCTPARASIMTGCYPPRVGLGDPDPERGDVLVPKSDVGLSPDELNLAEVMKAAGYRTAMIGKWHLGRDSFMPHHQGFDLYYGPHSRSRIEEVAALRRNDKVVEAVPHADLTRRYTEETIEFIRSEPAAPFFVYLAHSMPHTPLAARESFLGTSPRGLYGDVVRELDWSTGAILDALEELGLRGRTLVVFTSDNGPAAHLRNAGGKAYPLRGGKGQTYEGGMRVPCITSWPGVVSAGVTSDVVWSTIDLLPTLARLARGPLPTLPIDGRDAVPVLLGRDGAKSPHRAFFYYHRNDLDAVRVGRWKLVFQQSEMAAKRYERLIPAALYDLERDIGETRNLQLRHPGVVEALKELAEQMIGELGDDKTGVTGTGRRPIGRLPVSSRGG